MGTFLLIKNEKEQSIRAKVTLFLIGTVFGTGLIISGMSQRAKIYGFLELNSKWDPSLLFVLMSGVLINIISFNFIIKFMYLLFYSERSQLMVKKYKTLMEKLI